MSSKIAHFCSSWGLRPIRSKAKSATNEARLLEEEDLLFFAREMAALSRSSLCRSRGPSLCHLLKSSMARRYASTAALRKNNWKPDVVYLYQFPRSPVMPNLSPFCMKVETFLRANDIKYEAIGSFRHRSKKGLLPFIELNGKPIADSQVIIWELQKHFSIDDKLVREERGTARALERMVELSTNYALLQDKSVLNGEAFMSRSVSGLPLPTFVTNFMAKRFSDEIGRRVKRILGRLTRDELKEALRRDIQAIEDVLQDKKFLFGDKMTVTEPFVRLCTSFGIF
ncbi:hypothetical protein Q1695_012257 [Nippostrongylus brasiliensis]|nr:hypothetical protein Q1695_012257 [Nippostrongylus brasiliensis]